MDLGDDRQYLALEEELQKYATAKFSHTITELNHTLARLMEENRSLRKENVRLKGDVEKSLPRRLSLRYCLEHAHYQPVHDVATCLGSLEQPSLMATASWDGAVNLIDIASGKSKHSWRCSKKGLYSVAFSKKLPLAIGVASQDCNVYLLNPETKGQSILGAHEDEVNCIDFHPEKNVLASVSDDGSCKIWDYAEATGQALRSLRVQEHHQQGADPRLYGCTFLGGEKEGLEFSVATCGFDRVTRIWDMRSNVVVSALGPSADDVIGLDFCPRTCQLATGADDGSIDIYDIRKLREKKDGKSELVTSIQTRAFAGLAQNEVKRVKFSPNGKLLAAACSLGCVLTFDTAEPHEIWAHAKTPNPQAIPDLAPPVFSVAWHESKAGKLSLATVAHDAAVCVYDVMASQ
eukprot:TRINITY_DN29042_c0_g1_i2.p1 TRINITY_DN29042_c0_g1~~TRINITY_DN29042_c0_g1_i2.p1  ORF type:complete len:405 (+),score=73.54 TRINITY_DN29042_c0_g1_i2:68-1282(+)